MIFLVAVSSHLTRKLRFQWYGSFATATATATEFFYRLHLALLTARGAAGTEENSSRKFENALESSTNIFKILWTGFLGIIFRLQVR